MRVTDERVKELMQSNTVTISSVADRRDLCYDLIEARELIKEMRSKLLVGGIQATEDMTMFRSIPVDLETITDLIKRTKEYAE